MPIPQNYGTLTTLDTLRASGTQTIVEFGEDKAFAAIAMSLAAHNSILDDFQSGLVETSTDRLRRYGGPASMYMDVVDQLGRADVQKIAAGVNIGFPMRKYQVALQWTRDYMEVATPQELAGQFTAAQDADILALTRELKKAIYTATNSTFTDVNVDNVTLPVKAFVNADGAAIPPGPNGEVFDPATHTHYFARVAALAASDINALVTAVGEHYANGRVVVYINRADEAAVRAFTTQFTPYVDARLIPAVTTVRAQGVLDQSNLYNRAIGIWDGGTGAAEVWVKPWTISGYMFAYTLGAPTPLVKRIRNAQRGALRLVADYDNYPLRAQTMEREFGVGVWNRANGAVLYVTAATTYVSPTIT